MKPVPSIAPVLLAALAGCTTIPESSNAVSAISSPPNIVLILADDMGYSDLGLFGSGIHTPNLDSLARDGLLMTRFYNEAKCTESRAALMSGRPHEAVLGASGKGGNTDRVLAGEIETIADAMKARGYRTMISGKWHLGESEDYWPDKRGFDDSFSLVTGASSYFEMRMREAQDDPAQADFWPAKPFMIDDGKRWTVPASGFYMTDAIGGKAREMIDAHVRRGDGRPFFLYLAYTAPHFPLHALPEDIARYKGKFDGGWDSLRATKLSAMTRGGLLPKGTVLSPRSDKVDAWTDASDKAEWARRMEVFAAQLDRLDQDVGKLIVQLKANGQYENTVIFFMSDNGAASMSPEQMAREFGYVVPGAIIGSPESNTTYGEPWAQASNTPLLEYKQSLYEGGIRTPLIVSWPNGLRQHGISSVPGQITDILPTALTLGGSGEIPASVTGTSLTDWLKGGAAPHRPLFWAFKRYQAVQLDGWKLLSDSGGRKWKLFELDSDPSESSDLAASNPEKVAQLRSLYEAWRAGPGKPYEGPVAR